MAQSIEPGKRLRCTQCGNLTRFDVVTTERTRTFWHVNLAGDPVAEEREVLAQKVESVTCRWCGAQDAVENVERP